MNSLLQQLFHIPSFADGLLSVELDHTDETAVMEKSSNSMVTASNVNENEKMIFQLQVLFGYLKLSQKRVFDTLGFCQSFIDYDGLPLSLMEQKDINEFGGMLFDKLESNAQVDIQLMLINTFNFPVLVFIQL